LAEKVWYAFLFLRCIVQFENVRMTSKSALFMTKFCVTKCQLHGVFIHKRKFCLQMRATKNLISVHHAHSLRPHTMLPTSV